MRLVGKPLTSCTGAQADPYIVAGIKQNRRQRTRTLSNTTHPVWEETLNIIVNDPDKQSLTFELMDDDPGAFDDVSSLLGW